MWTRAGNQDPHQLLQSQVVSVTHARPADQGKVVEPDSVEPVGNEILQHKDWFQCLEN
jgi:hypothetical protein